MRAPELFVDPNGSHGSERLAVRLDIQTSLGHEVAVASEPLEAVLFTVGWLEATFPGR